MFKIKLRQKTCVVYLVPVQLKKFYLAQIFNTKSRDIIKASCEERVLTLYYYRNIRFYFIYTLKLKSINFCIFECPVILSCEKIKFEQINVNFGLWCILCNFLKAYSDYDIRSTPLFYCVSTDRCRWFDTGKWIRH